MSVLEQVQREGSLLLGCRQAVQMRFHYRASPGPDMGCMLLDVPQACHGRHLGQATIPQHMVIPSQLICIW